MKAYQLKNLRPAAVWQDATPVGNGRDTALVYGNVWAEKILLNHEKWWYKESTPPFPDFGNALQKCRKLMDEGNFAAADRVFPDEMKKHRPFAACALYQPGIDLRIESALKGEYTDYSRTLDMARGEAVVRYRDGEAFERSVFISRADGVAVVRIRGERAWSGRIWLEPHELERAVGIFGEPFCHGLTFRTEYIDGCIRLFGKRNSIDPSVNGTFAIIGSSDREHNFGAILRICARGGARRVLPYSENDLNIMMPPQEAGMQDGVIVELEGAEEAVLLVKLYEGSPDIAALQRDLENVDPDYSALLARHAAAHGALFDRVAIDFCRESDRSCEQLILDAQSGSADGELLNKLWYFGRYLFLISAGEGCLPAHLSGKWNGDYFAPWRGVYFIDENTEIIYWQAFAGNLPELALPLFDLFDSKLPDFRENARKMYGCRGIRMPLSMDPFSGHEKDYSPHALYWNAGAAWISSMYYDYYEFTGDERFLLERAYPFMKETALFFEDYLVEREGVLHSYPGTSPENCANGSFEGAKKVSASIDATMDISALKCLLRRLIAVSEKFAIDGEARARWAEMLRKLPPYRVNKDGALAEWICPAFKDNYEHRHISHLFPVFPGTEFANDVRMTAAAKRALELRMREGLRAMTGWALAHIANVQAHLHNADGVENCLKLIARHFTGENLFGYHNNDKAMGVGLYSLWCNHAPHQLDVSSGFTSAVQECICFASEDTIELLPALSCDKVQNLTARGIVMRGGFTLDLLEKKKDGLTVRITSRKDREITVRLPAGFEAETGEKTIGEEVRVRFAAGQTKALRIKAKRV